MEDKSSHELSQPIQIPRKPEQVADSSMDGVMVATPPKSDTPTTTPTNSERVFIPRGESPHFSVLLPETLHVSPTDLRDLIVEGTEDADIAIFLVIVNGLPYCRKSEIFRKLLTSLVPKADELVPKADEHRPAHGLSHYELAAVGQPEPHRIHKPALGYSAITSEDCYLYAMKSAMTQVGGTSLIKYEEGDGLPAGKKFKHEGLNVHLHDMFSQLKSNEKISSMGIRGVALFNVWDIGHSRTVYHFLPALHGLLNHSYSWLFFDLQRDSQNLYKPLNLSTPDKPSSNDENVMKFKPRLHYLIRHAQLNLPAKEKVCSILAVNNSSNSDAQNIADLLKPDFENAAAKIGVKENIDFDAVMVIQPDKNEELIKDKLDVLIKKELRSKRNVPFSFLFLRSFYYKNDAIVYIKKEEVKQLAVELNISDQKFKEFCELFTSCGSIVDVSLIDKHSKYIIMKPNLFLKEIDEIYHTKDKTLANTGILTLSAAEEMFGLHADAYMEILVSLSLAVELTREQVELPDSINDKVWYLPDSRTTPPCEDTTELRPTVLRLLRSLNAPPGHLQTSFVSEFLKISEGSKVCVPEDKSYPNNITKIIAFDNITETTVAIKFDVVYLGYTLEFRIDTANEKIFSHIIETCHKVMEHQHHKETTYNFAILCSKNPRSTSAGAKYELTRERHFLPYATTLCDKCKSDERHKNPILDMWNKVVEKKKFSEERKLNGDYILLDDAHKIAKKLDGLHSNTFKELKDKLGIKHDEMMTKLTGWKLLMAILLECEKMSDGPEPMSKRAFARKLAETVNDITSEKDKERLWDAVKLLDDEVFKDLTQSSYLTPAITETTNDQKMKMLFQADEP